MCININEKNEWSRFSTKRITFKNRCARQLEIHQIIVEIKVTERQKKE